MKMIKCPKCDDMVALRPWRKSCKCGFIYGKYLDDGKTVMVSRSSIVLGMPNWQIFKIRQGDAAVVFDQPAGKE